MTEKENPYTELKGIIESVKNGYKQEFPDTKVFENKNYLKIEKSLLDEIGALEDSLSEINIEDQKLTLKQEIQLGNLVDMLTGTNLVDMLTGTYDGFLYGYLTKEYPDCDIDSKYDKIIAKQNQKDKNS